MRHGSDDYGTGATEGWGMAMVPAPVKTATATHAVFV